MRERDIPFYLQAAAATTTSARNTMSLTRAYEEVIDFIAAGTSPDHVAAFRPSEESRQRVADLVQREKTSGLTMEERSELEHYLQLEHLMRLAKARARQHVSAK